MVVVADVAFAHQDAREVFERVFAVGGVGGAGQLLARDAFHRGRNLGRQRRGLATGNNCHHAEGLCGHVCRSCSGGLRQGDERECGGHSQRDAMQLHERLRNTKNCL